MRVFGEEEKTREGGRELDSDSLLGTRKRWTLVQLVRPDDDEDPCDMDEENAMAADGVPALRSVGSSAYAIGKFAKEIDSYNGIWRVVTYFDSSAPSTAPEVEWYWDGETIDKVIQRDPITGNPIVNAVNEPLIVTTPITIPILTIERVEEEFDPDTILAYCNRTNSISFWGAPPGCALMHSIKDAPVYQGGAQLRKVTYVIKFDLSWDFDTGLMYGWAVQLLNHGTKWRYQEQIITPDGRLVLATEDEPVYIPFTDLNKNPTTGNLNLDGTPRDPALGPTWILYNRHLRANLNVLDLGPYV